MKHYMDKFEHGGFFYATARRGQDADQLLDFSVNINPLGLSESVRQAVRGALEEIIYYPDAAAVLLKEAIAERYQVDSVGILAGNGAAELLYVLCHVLRPKTVVIPAPTFSEYERAALSAGASIHYVPLCTENGFSLPVGNILKIIPEADLVFLCNPNNPTGRLELKSDLEIIVAQANKHNTLVVLDESFVDFVADAEKVTCKPLLAKYSNLVIVQSLTKI
ncbi:MAG: L-threonine-O-3-phosphate decarboxylase, partial [Firmicutes bacterium]|nr:L-threonine-O-3-phosphate decarboxylase [Bacillota bacterium]